MKNILRILLLTMMIGCWSCGSGEEDVPTPTPTPKPEEKPKIEVTTTAPILAQTGGTGSVTFTSTADWTIDVTEGRAVSWCSVSPTSGSKGTNTLTITTTGNDTYDERNAKVTIKAGTTSQSFTVTQKQKDGLTVTSNKVEIGSDGGDFSIEAKANVSVTYEIEEAAKDWISASESRGLTAKTLNFTAKANEKEERRLGNIVLKGGDGLTETVTVYQEGEKPTLVITSDDIIVGSDGETIKIEIKSNVDYTMTMPEVDWISQDDSRAISAYTHYLTVASNEFYDQRSAKIFFQNEAEGLKDSISITQLQKDAIIVAKNEYTVAAEGGNLDFSVNTNVDFEVSVSVDWIKQNTGSRGLVEKPLRFIVAENDSTKSREGEIVITFEELKQAIKVKQSGAIDYDPIERAALIEFYKATGGDNWTRNDNWCSDKPLNEWYGVVTNDRKHVIALYLDWNNLTGSIPENIGELVNLEQLYLYKNQLSGNIPESIGKLVNLKYFYFDYNQLSGNIPESIGNLKALIRLVGNDNQLSGKLPESIGHLTSLETLWLSDNQISGIPANIGNAKKLTYLNLSYNQISGNIPESIGNLTSLEHLSFNENRISGNIPESIGKLTSLTRLWLCANKISGNIPESIGNLTSLTSLYLYFNQLSGSIPESIGNLKALEECLLERNQLSGSIPESIGNLTNLNQISLNDNQLSGKIPYSLTTLNVWKNQWQWVLKGNKDLDVEGCFLPVPENIITDIDGNIVFLGEEYTNNKLTVLYKWGTYCGYSKSYNITLAHLYEKYKNRGLEIIGISHADDVAGEIAYIKEQGIPWRNCVYRIEECGIEVLLTRATPELIVIDHMGKVVFQSFTKNYQEFSDWLLEYFPAGSSDNIYTSTDYSCDGDVVILQTASIGQGINLTFMGEGFVDKDMEANGLYEQKMKEAMESFFSIEPYASMRNRFNVYAVKVVSPNSDFDVEGAVQRINRNPAIAFEYARKIPNADLNPPMVTVIYNSWYQVMRSRCKMYTDGSFVSYIMGPDIDGGILLHETGGHGFANLLDEYVEEGYGSLTLPEEGRVYLNDVWSQWSIGANVDWHNEVSTVKWAHFLSDDRYASEGLGIYEGAYLYGYGAYRPTNNSIMRESTKNNSFNAPSREQIYKRIMQLSEGENWKYDYEEFVKFDAKNRNAASRSAFKPLTETERQEYIKNHRPPTIIKGTWHDAMKGKGKVVVPLR